MSIFFLWLLVLFVHPVCFCCEFVSDGHSNYRNVYIVLLLEPREFTCVILVCINSTSQRHRELNGSRPFHFRYNRVGVTCMQPRLEKSSTAIVVYLFTWDVHVEVSLQLKPNLQYQLSSFSPVSSPTVLHYRHWLVHLIPLETVRSYIGYLSTGLFTYWRPRQLAGRKTVCQLAAAAHRWEATFRELWYISAVRWNAALISYQSFQSSH